MKQSLNNKDVMHEMGLPFYPFAKWYHIEVDVTDLDYIVNVIKKDKCFHLILQAYLMEDEIANKLARAYAQINIIVFFDKFYNDVNCPRGVHLILFALLGVYRNYVVGKFPNLLSERYRYVERWLVMAT